MRNIKLTIEYDGKDFNGWQKQPNELGLYDMTGNVWEMCSDWEGLYYYEESPSTDPQGPNSPESSKRYRIVRGGAFVSDPAQCRTSYRSWSAESSNNINLGFRLVLEK